jgi:hypothetical protein
MPSLRMAMRNMPSVKNHPGELLVGKTLGHVGELLRGQQGLSIGLQDAYLGPDEPGDTAEWLKPIH